MSDIWPVPKDRGEMVPRKRGRFEAADKKVFVDWLRRVARHLRTALDRPVTRVCAV